LPDETAADPPRGVVRLLKNITRKTYDVYGSDAAEVTDFIQKNSPVILEAYEAVTTAQSEIYWSYDHLIESNPCKVTDGVVTVDIIVTMPRWVNISSAPADDQKRWDAYLVNVNRHEQGHVNIAMQAAREAQLKLSELFATSVLSCSEIENEAINKLEREIKDKRLQNDTAYDNRTNHGKTQESTLDILDRDYCRLP
jgi:predicted secreted Zn-dependent protease